MTLSEVAAKEAERVMLTTLCAMPIESSARPKDAGAEIVIRSYGEVMFKLGAEWALRDLKSQAADRGLMPRERGT